jgi:hypothetical protein
MDQVVGQALATFRRINEQIPVDQDSVRSAVADSPNIEMLANVF